MSKTIAILGAGPALGLSVARRFGREGYQVALVARRREQLARLTESLHADDITAQAFPADLESTATIPGVVASIEQELGPIDVLLYAPAGSALFSPAADLTAKHLDEYAPLALHGLVESVHSTLPGMLDRGEGTIFYASPATAMGAPAGMSGPAVVGAAARHYLQTLAAEVGPQGVHVGALFIAGFIDHSAAIEMLAAAGPVEDSGFPIIDPDDLAELLWSQHLAKESGENVYPS